MSLLERRPAVTASDPVSLYDEVARQSAELVIRRYSTSFGLASRLLREPVRTHVRAVYAMVRLADEVVDAPRPGIDTAGQRACLDELEREVLRGLETGHSTNLIVHAFAVSGRQAGIGADLVRPFFASMRTDLERTEHDQRSFEEYVYGSAEVVGLMCLKVFLMGSASPQAEYDALAPGARRLGAAFQKVNFLRDLAEDAQLLGRSYFPGIDPRTLDEAQKGRLLDDIQDDLEVARRAVERLPDSSRRAVRAAHALFAELARELRATAAADIRERRVRVTTPVKVTVVARSLLGLDR